MPSSNQLSLPPALRAWVKQQVRARGFENESDFIRDLVRREKERAREVSALEATLLDAIDSGDATPMTDSDWKDIEKQGMARLTRKRK